MAKKNKKKKRHFCNIPKYSLFNMMIKKLSSRERERERDRDEGRIRESWTFLITSFNMQFSIPWVNSFVHTLTATVVNIEENDFSHLHFFFSFFNLRKVTYSQRQCDTGCFINISFHLLIHQNILRLKSQFV